jgi:hypothetical protein
MLSREQMDLIGQKHGIHPHYQAEFLKLANEGRINNDEFGDRLVTCQNYQLACEDVMHVLAQPIQHYFEEKV